MRVLSWVDELETFAPPTAYLHPREYDALARFLGVPPENVHVSDAVPPGTALIGRFPWAKRPVWEPRAPRWPGEALPVLFASLMRALVRVAQPGRWPDLGATDPRGWFVPAPPPRTPWTHFTLLEDGGVLDHTPWLYGHSHVPPASHRILAGAFS
jgi:hypothetical protein